MQYLGTQWPMPDLECMCFVTKQSWGNCRNLCFCFVSKRCCNWLHLITQDLETVQATLTLPMHMYLKQIYFKGTTILEYLFSVILHLPLFSIFQHELSPLESHSSCMSIFTFTNVSSLFLKEKHQCSMKPWSMSRLMPKYSQKWSFLLPGLGLALFLLGHSYNQSNKK